MRMLPKRMTSLIGLGVLLAVLGSMSVAIAVEVGQPAPDFTLSSTMGEKISLSQFRGEKHVFIEFYLSDFGPT